MNEGEGEKMEERGGKGEGGQALIRDGLVRSNRRP